MVQSFKFSAAQTVIRGIANEVRQAYYWVKELDTAITNIGVVTGKTGEQLDAITKQTIEGAKNLRIAAGEYARGQLIFYQQGLGDEEVLRRTEITVKAAKAAGQSVQEMSSQLTAIWNTYKMGAEEQQRAASVGAQMAAQTAVDFADIAEAMQTAAAPAAQMGVEYNSLAAIIATVGDTTQQSASVIGNAYKTIFSRFQQLKSEGTDGEVTLNRVSSQLQELGVNVLDSSGQLRQLDNVIQEVGNSWDQWSSKQQLAIAQLVGGTRQYGQFLALMNNFDKYQQLLSAANQEDGSTLEQQYTQALDSIESRAENVGEAWKRAFSNFLPEDDIKAVLKLFEELGNLTNFLVQAFGGLPGILSLVATILSQKIAKSLTDSAAQAKLLIKNLTPEGRAAGIRQEYTDRRNALETKLSENKDERKQIISSGTKANISEQAQNTRLKTNAENKMYLLSAKQKLQVDEKIALVNDQINTKMKTATGEQKIILEMDKNRLEEIQKRNTEVIDGLNLLDQELQKEDQLLVKEQQRLKLEEERNLLAIQQYTKKEGNLQDTYDTNQGEIEKYEEYQRLKDKLPEAQNRSSIKNEQEYNAKLKEQEQLLVRISSLRQKIDELEARSLVIGEEKALLETQKKAVNGYRELTAELIKLKLSGEQSSDAMIVKMNSLLDTLEAGGIDTSNFNEKVKSLMNDGVPRVDALEQAFYSLVQQIVGVDSSLDSVHDDFVTLSGDKTIIDGKVDEMRNKYPSPGQPGAPKNQDPPSPKPVQNLGVAYTQLAISALSAGTALANCTKNFLEANTASEKLTAVLQGLTTVLPIVLMLYSQLSSLNVGAALGAKLAGKAFLGMGISAQAGAAMATMGISILITGVMTLLAALPNIIEWFKQFTPEGKLEAAREEAESLANALDTVKQKGEELVQSFDKYDGAVSKLKSCVEGTDEWAEALQNVNNYVLELIRLFPELNQYVSRNEEGMLEISEQGRQIIMDQQDNNLLAAQAAKLKGDQRVREAEINVQKDNTSTDVRMNVLNGRSNVTSVYEDGGSIYKDDKEIKTTNLSYDRDIQDILENILISEAEEIAQSTPDEIQKIFKRELEEQGIQVKTLETDENNQYKVGEYFDPATLQIISQEIYDNYGEEVSKMGKAITENTDLIETENQMLADSIIAAKNLDISKEASKTAGKLYGLLYSEAETELKNKKLSKEDTLSQYAESTGTNTSGGSWDGDTYTFADGKTLTKQDMEAGLAAIQAQKDFVDKMTNLGRKIDSLSESTDQTDKALGNFLANRNFGNMTEEQYNSISSLNEEDRQNLFNSKFDMNGDALFDENDARELGFSTVEEFITAWETGIAKVNWKTINDNLPETLKNVESLTASSAEKITAQYERISRTSGKEIADIYANELNMLVSEASAEDRGKIFDIFANTDWSQLDAAEKAAKQIRELGYEVDTTSDNWLYFKDCMQKAFKAKADIKTTLDLISQIQEISGDLEIGSIISSEDYQLLVNFNSELAKYFTILGDGSAMLTGDILEMQQIVNQTAQDQLKDTIQQYTQMQGELPRISDSNIQKASEDSEYDYTYKGSAALGQIDYIEAYGGASQEQIDNWRKAIDVDNNYYVEDIQTIRDIQAAFNELGLTAETVQGQIQGAMNSLAATATNYEELKALYDDGKGDINQEAFDSASLNLQTKDKWEDMDSKEVEKYADYLQKAADASGEFGEKSEFLSDELKDNEKAAKDVALYTKKMTQGVEKLADGFEDWSDILDKSDSGSEEYMSAMSGMKNAMSDVLGVSEDFLSDDFILQNMEDIKLAAEGDADAIDRLAIAAGRDIIVNLDIADEGVKEEVLALHDQLVTEIPDIKVGATIDDGDFLTKAAQIVEKSGMTVAEANAYFRSMGFEPTFETKEVDVTRTPQGTRTYRTVTQWDDAYDTNGEVIGSYPSVIEEHTESFDLPPVTEKIEVPALTTDGGEPNFTLTRTNAGGMNNYSGANSGGPSANGSKGGGGGKTPTHSAKKASKYEPMTDRYASIKSSIDEVQRSVDALSNAEDDAWGGDKVRNMQKINKELQKQAKNLQKLRSLALDYLKTDQKDAQLARKDLLTNLAGEKLPGLKLDQVLFNSDGFVSNKTEITKQLNDYLESLYTPYYERAMAYDRADSTNEKEAEEIDKLKEKYDTAKAFVDQFLEALGLVDETAQEAADALERELENIREWMANKVEEATYKMEFKIGINERDISLIEQAIKLWDTLGSKMGKTFDLLGARLTKESEKFYNTLEHGNRMIEIIENIDPTNPEDAKWFKDTFSPEAWDKYIESNGALPAEVLEAMQDDADSMIDYMNSMYDTAEEMFGQYIEVLNMYMDEFDKIANKISANNDKLEMFQELLEFSGKRYTAAGRNSIRGIADATVQNAVLETERAASALELAKQGAEETSKQLKDFLEDTGKDPADFDEVEAFTYNQLKAAKDEADQILADAQSDMTSSISDLAAAAADAIEMVAEVIKEEVGKNLGGDFASIEDMMTMYDQQYDLDTFFLRDFDKEYQLNSLLGEIDDQMADITDPGRLQEYEKLIEEINAANQEGVNLTQKDVDLLKAKFEVQKAQDAYEEAQNAKNTMRLARDASGNWSYVYSQDQDKTDDAAQKLADAQYNYEKLLWEASDEASQYWLQAQQDFFEFQDTIDWARYEHDEQYRAQIDKQLAYYQEKTELYASQVTKYNDMLGVSFDQTTLGVVTNMESMESAQKWYTSQHEDYTNKLNENTQHYQQVVNDACKNVGIDYDNLEQTVDDETELMMKENNALRDTMKKLNTEGGQALSQLNTKVTAFRVKFVEDMKLAKKALEEFLNKLESYEEESLNRMEYTGFNAQTDYTAAIGNYIGQQASAGKTAEELLKDETLIRYAYELGNKLHSEELKEAGHTTVVERWDQRNEYDAMSYLTATIADIMKSVQEGVWKAYENTVDEWSVQNKNKIDEQYKTASGGLIKTPQVRSLAEEGPELVLNADDTQNILNAVKHMREVVKMKMQNINTNLGKKTEDVVERSNTIQDIQQIDQQVHIDATFPNVSVASEIEEAFSNLVNQAVQYASAQRQKK